MILLGSLLLREHDAANLHAINISKGAASDVLVIGHGTNGRQLTLVIRVAADAQLTATVTSIKNTSFRWAILIGHVLVRIDFLRRVRHVVVGNCNFLVGIHAKSFAKAR